MKVFYISPIGKTTPMLFDTFPFESTDNLDEAACVFVDVYSWLGEYEVNLLNKTIEQKLPIILFDESDYGGCKDGTDIWFYHKKTSDGINLLQVFIMTALSRHIHIVYFMRKMDKIKQYPSWVHPYELIMYPDHIFPIVTKEELFNREFDICYIGNISPQRVSVSGELQKHFKCDFQLGLPRIDHTEWLNRHRNAKMYLEADGGGYGSERRYQLPYIAAEVKQRNNQLILHDFRDGLENITVSEYPTTQEIKILKDVLNDEDMLYEIYLAGIKRIEKYFNQTFRTEYILKTLETNGIS